jgi:DNA-binding transcriptional MocR family regulator
MISTIKQFFTVRKPEPVRSPRKYRVDGPDKLLIKIRGLEGLNPQRGCFASNRHFAGEFGVSERTISRWISELTARGLVRLSGTGKGRTIHYCGPQPQSSRMRKDRSKVVATSMSRPTTTKDCRGNGVEMARDCRGNGVPIRASDPDNILTLSVQEKPVSRFTDEQWEEIIASIGVAQ